DYYCQSSGSTGNHWVF
nr:immunoglobulin light chain junction region [Macaca mulatta]MOX36477.1 immunoglobulin light chain junction region [Macaca mulatta]MOX37234.1 immunoglobulin light chain junction region [Macaca mulatta]MOX37290.1 immunoglobulin light chain junction region [Macaca mulatta]MOX37536.1 immunoglobulin light chain junction region [Macaca mulatta]